jgi:hypothetical protein
MAEYSWGEPRRRVVVSRSYPMLLVLSSLAFACGSGAAPAVEEAAPAAEAAAPGEVAPARPAPAPAKAPVEGKTGVEPPPAKVDADAPPAPEPEPTPPAEKLFDTRTIAAYGGVPWPVGTGDEELPRLWPGVSVRPDTLGTGTTVVIGPKLEVLLQVTEDGEACLTGPGIVDATGIGVGMTLAEVPGLEAAICEIAMGDELAHRSAGCPDYGGKDIKLVCDLRENAAHRVFFDVGHEHVERAGEELRQADLAALGEPTVAAIVIAIGLNEVVGPPEGDPPPPTPTTASGPSFLLAKTSGASPHELRSDAPGNPAGIEAALPGVDARMRRFGGINVYRDGKKLADVSPRDDGTISSVTLLAPGLVDANGIEVGAKIDALAGIAGLACEVVFDEGSDGYVSCGSEASGIHYDFELGHARDVGPLSFDAAKKRVGKRKLSSISIWVPAK